MSKKCIICDAKARFCIKGRVSDCYCEECAIEQFGDVTYLIKVEDAAKQLKNTIDQFAEEGINAQSDETVKHPDQTNGHEDEPDSKNDSDY